MGRVASALGCCTSLSLSPAAKHLRNYKVFKVTKLPKGPLNLGINNQNQKNQFKNQLDSRRGETQTGPEDAQGFGVPGSDTLPQIKGHDYNLQSFQREP